MDNDSNFRLTFENQEAFEAHDGVSKGRYTLGYAQDSMAFCTDVEDIISMSLTAVTSLLEKYEISPKQIGRLEVGSKTVLDRTKSIKTFLMEICEENGNTDIEDVDSTNACYGGTAALFNCINWIESSSWDGRYGLVVCTDSANYAELPTGGAGTVAMLVGVDAPIVFESKLRGSHMTHTYDAYKPDLLNPSEHPVVDMKLVSICCPRALGICYKHFCSKYEKFEGKQFSVNDADYFLLHSPFTKYVQKCFGGLLFNDFLRNASSINEEAEEKFAPFATLSGDEIYLSKDLEKASQQVAKPTYDAKVQPATLLAKETGNTGTASLYMTLASLIHTKQNTLVGNRLIMYSFGSGLAATMFSLRVNPGQHPFTVSNIASILNVDEKLKARHEFPVEKFLEILKVMEKRCGAKDFVTSKETSILAPGTYYLIEVDSMYRRIYAKKAGESACVADGN